MPVSHFLSNEKTNPLIKWIDGRCINEKNQVRLYARFVTFERVAPVDRGAPGFICQYSILLVTTEGVCGGGVWWGWGCCALQLHLVSSYTVSSPP